jgi:hypothetical protein
MATINPLNKFIQLLSKDSTSWGALAILAIAVSAMVLLMLLFSYGWSISDLPLF